MTAEKNRKEQKRTEKKLSYKDKLPGKSKKIEFYG